MVNKVNYKIITQFSGQISLICPSAPPTAITCSSSAPCAFVLAWARQSKD